jgi:DNA-binding CsgD family transcriptional regulator
VKYVIDKCRCEPCTIASSDAQREARHRIEPAYVLATPVRQHCLALMAQGMGPKSIAKAAGISHGGISKLIYGDYKGRGPSKRVRLVTAQRVLAVTPADAAPAQKIDAAPTWRLLNEMIDAGAPKSQIAVHLGMKGPGLQIRTGQVRASTARAVAELHRRWKAGEVQFVNRHRNLPAPLPVAVPVAVRRTHEEIRERYDDIAALYSAFADVIEERNSQPWRAQAACRGREVSMWFPARGDRKTLAAALKVCGACFVRAECAEAFATSREGVYGGLSGRGRRAA